jgi:hypothetical protein
MPLIPPGRLLPLLWSAYAPVPQRGILPLFNAGAIAALA